MNELFNQQAELLMRLQALHKLESVLRESKNPNKDHWLKTVSKMALQTQRQITRNMTNLNLGVFDVSDN